MGLHRHHLLAKARQGSGRTQIDIARKLRVSQSTVSAWEAGTQTPRKLRAVARAYGIDVALLVP
jgi:transcriptional regulator with XRE-family HTH domain